MATQVGHQAHPASLRYEGWVNLLLADGTPYKRRVLAKLWRNHEGVWGGRFRRGHLAERAWRAAAALQNPFVGKETCRGFQASLFQPELFPTPSRGSDLRSSVT